MFDSFKSSSAAIAKYTPTSVPSGKTQFKFNFKRHLENTLFFAWNMYGWFARTKGNPSKNGGTSSKGRLRIDSGLDVKMGLALNLEYKSLSKYHGTCKVGKNTAYHADDGNYSANLFIGFFNDLDQIPDIPSAEVYPGEIDSLNFGTAKNYKKYYLDLRNLSKEKKYCKIYVNNDPENPSYCLIEGKVHIHILTTGTKNSKPVVIYGKESDEADWVSPEKGWPLKHVINRDIYVNLENEEEAYLIALVVPTEKAKNSFSFEVGDPRDDADVDVEEV